MALDILVWVFAGAFAACAIIVVYLIFAFIMPIKNSPGKYFVKAKRERKPIIIADTGKFFRFIVGDEKIGEEKNQVIRQGTDMIKIPNIGGLKYAEGNVLMGVAEDFRAMVTNVAITDLLQYINTNGWDTEKVNKMITELTTNLKIDLGYINGGEEARKQYEEDIAMINSQFDEAIKNLKKQEVNPDDQEIPLVDGDNPEEAEDE